MSVYVDDAFLPFGRMLMCHMVADTVTELHEMADAIGVDRRWFQKPEKRPHYDICKSKRALAIKHGAKEIRWREILPIIERCRAAASPVVEAAATEGGQG